jgi:hypothetical protein
MTHRHQRGWLKKKNAVTVKLGSCSFVPFGNPTVSECRTRFQLALSKTSLLNTLHGKRWKGNISRSTRVRSGIAAARARGQRIGRPSAKVSDAEIRNLLASGLSMLAVGERLGISSATVCRRARQPDC